MGDRCWLNLRTNAEGRDIISKIIGLDPSDWEEVKIARGSSLFAIEEEEANYGWTDELERAAAMGAVFEGSHSAGDDYGPYVFCGVDGKYASCDEVYGGGAAVEVDTLTGEPRPADLVRVRSFAYRNREAHQQLYGRCVMCDPVKGGYNGGPCRGYVTNRIRVIGLGPQDGERLVCAVHAKALSALAQDADPEVEGAAPLPCVWIDTLADNYGKSYSPPDRTK